MPWLTIIMALVSFFMAGGSKKENRGKAAAVALGVGAATYGVTHYTDWGRENLGTLDGVTVSGGNDSAVTTQNPDGSVRTPATTPTGGISSPGIWSTVGGWLSSPAGQITTGAAGASLLGFPKWVVWGGAALGAYLLLKD